MSARPVAFISDFGLDDEFVGVVHAVIARHAPGAAVIDVTHLIPAHDIAVGAFTLWRAAPWLAPGVILAVVDPGVGTDRRAVALEVAESVLIGPDNGLLMPAANRLGGVTRAVRLPTDTGAPGATFAGRDVFAPAAGRVAAGEDLSALGVPVDPDTLVDLVVPVPLEHADGIGAEVLWVDRFGNAQLNVAASTAGPVDGIEVGGRHHEAPVVGSYGDIPAGGYALVVDSYGMLSVCADRRPAATALGLGPGTAVRLCRLADPRP